MNTHFTQEEFVLAYYDEPDLGARRDHLGQCAACRAELGRLAHVLDQVGPIEVPEPPADFESRMWDRVSWRLRSERQRRQRTPWIRWTAAAAVLAAAFTGGLLWNRASHDGPAPAVAVKSAPAAAASTQAQRDRILLVVVNDHFDQSERVLVELVNLTPGAENDITSERERAAELLASNRLYRSSAAGRGEKSVATLLDELEPVLLQIAHAPDQLTADELRTIQKRVESKGLVFKLRIVGANAREKAQPERALPTV